MRVFLSYSRRDAEFVGRLADDLEARGVEAWLDTDDLPISDEDRWRRGVVRGIRDSTAVILVLSPDSVASAPVERELTIAAEIGCRIVPIVCRPCELSDGMMFELAGLQRTDFVDQPYETALDQLVRRVSAGAPGSAAPASPPMPDEAESGRPIGHEPEPNDGGRPAEGEPREIRVTDPARIGGPSRVHLGSSDDPAVTRSDRPRWLTIASVGAVGAVIVALIVINLIRGDAGTDAKGDEPATTTGPSSTVVTSASTRATSAASTEAREPTANSAADVPAPATSVPAATTTTPVTSTTLPSTTTTLTGEQQAYALLDDLRIAYELRNWDRVRELNLNQASLSDEQFERGYGGLRKAFYPIHDTEYKGSSVWKLTGTLFAWDTEATGDRTNVVCYEWVVDLDNGTVTPKSLTNSLGEPETEVAGRWVPEDEMPALTAKYCR